MPANPSQQTTSTAAQASLRAQGLHKSFVTGSVKTSVLRGLDLEVYAGQFTLISGPSGCGKSTLLSLLSGLQQADQGRVEALGQCVSSMRGRELQRFRLAHTGFVFQGFNLFPALTAQEQIELLLGYVGKDRKTSKALALQALRDVDMEHRAQLRPAHLSGGEKQRVAIARAISKQPELLFVDEPTSALDAENGQRVVDLLQHFAKQQGATVLCVSHDARVMRYADRIVQMEDGQVINDLRGDAAARMAAGAQPDPSAARY
ncbi:ABC transporter ATP-binding protein [Carnimonas bestiolae]|uniref:ABC transporter ATP-binding protein n=1 Tax=Carnimonas bestiolae TaxID=3402172 RepID=UPI003EDBFA14